VAGASERAAGGSGDVSRAAPRGEPRAVGLHRGRPLAQRAVGDDLRRRIVGREQDVLGGLAFEAR
jgi:hypothetical protein